MVAEFSPRSIPEKVQDEQIQGFLRFTRSFHNLQDISSEHYRLLAEKTRLILDYSGLENPNVVENRYISSGNVLVFLPPNPNDREQEIGTWIAQESSPRVNAYAARFGLKQEMVLPVIMYRSDDEVAKIVKNPTWSGVISLSYAPLLTTFNCQGMAYALDKLGDDLGTKATRFSFLHENGHPLLVRERYRLAQEAGCDLRQIAETTRALIIGNHFAYEEAANDIQDDLTGFPFGVAELEDRHTIITPENVVSYSYSPSGPPNELSERMDKVMYPSREGSSVKIPFVASPQVAHGVIVGLGIARELRENDPGFTWTQFLLDHVREDPLIQQEIGMPDNFWQIVGELTN